jgi:hypothetical protein
VPQPLQSLGQQRKALIKACNWLCHKEDNSGILVNPQYVACKTPVPGTKNLQVQTVGDHGGREMLRQAAALGLLGQPAAGGHQMQAIGRDGTQGFVLALPDFAGEILLLVRA